MQQTFLDHQKIEVESAKARSYDPKLFAQKNKFMEAQNISAFVFGVCNVVGSTISRETHAVND